MHPNGRFLYVSNRGDDSIAIFALAIIVIYKLAEGPDSSSTA